MTIIHCCVQFSHSWPMSHHVTRYRHFIGFFLGRCKCWWGGACNNWAKLQPVEPLEVKSLGMSLWEKKRIPEVSCHNVNHEVLQHFGRTFEAEIMFITSVFWGEWRNELSPACWGHRMLRKLLTLDMKLCKWLATWNAWCCNFWVHWSGSHLYDRSVHDHPTYSISVFSSEDTQSRKLL